MLKKVPAASFVKTGGFPVSKWEVVYHEILGISNTFRRLTNFTLGASESELHRELDGDNAKVFNAQVTNITNFLIAHGNPYLPESTTTAQYYLQCTCFRSCHTATEFYKNSVESYLSFRNQWFVEKSNRLSGPIKKINLQQFLPDEKEKAPRKSSNIDVKDLSDLQRNVDVARGRGISLVQVMEHDLLSTNILFDGDYTSNPTTNQSLFESWKGILKVENWTLRISLTFKLYCSSILCQSFRECR